MLAADEGTTLLDQHFAPVPIYDAPTSSPAAAAAAAAPHRHYTRTLSTSSTPSRCSWRSTAPSSIYHPKSGILFLALLAALGCATFFLVSGAAAFCANGW
ncbi:hypothetical protein HYPSUDRAFT_36329 [Hypholoma sublateritium FD-334 SS-4]|uniref:Uncharacterized protein n=1 Tax=Hypholoma sublateritium (strain FD-334 SS-4) TaxID=945553 RepID=A0A0D2PDK0_HYPSF|nr:hypothetical protein HYPSUDRAFT_36329 [Hypholoma sublateritium FD-334 SS-4]